MTGDGIAPLTPDHADACVAVVASLPEWFGYEGALDGVRRAAETQNGFVEIELGVVVGFVTIDPLYDETTEITYLAVRADRRRRGIGRRLVLAAFQATEERGGSSVVLLTLGPTAGNMFYEESVAFYRALGFLRTKELELSSWGNAPALVMTSTVDRIH